MEFVFSSHRSVCWSPALPELAEHPLPWERGNEFLVVLHLCAWLLLCFLNFLNKFLHFYPSESHWRGRERAAQAELLAGLTHHRGICKGEFSSS